MSKPDVSAASLKSIELFSTLKKPALEYLAGLVHIKKISPNHKVYGPSDVRDKLLIVRKGSLTISKKVGEEDMILSHFNEGEFLGEEIIFNPGGYHRYIIKSHDEATEILELKVYDLLKLIQKFPETSNLMQQQIIHALNQRLYATDERLAAIYSLGKLVSQDLTPDNLDTVLQLVAENANVSKTLLASFDVTSKQIIIERSKGYRPALSGQRYSLDTDTVLTIVHNSKDSFFISPKSWEKQFSMTQYAKKNFLAVPLMVGNDAIGALCVAEKEKDKSFNPNDEILLNSLAKLIAPAVRSLQHQSYAKNQEYLRRNFIDPLT